MPEPGALPAGEVAAAGRRPLGAMPRGHPASSPPRILHQERNARTCPPKEERGPQAPAPGGWPKESRQSHVGSCAAPQPSAPQRDLNCDNYSTPYAQGWSAEARSGGAGRTSCAAVGRTRSCPVRPARRPAWPPRSAWSSPCQNACQGRATACGCSTACASQWRRSRTACHAGMPDYAAPSCLECQGAPAVT